PRGCSGRTGWAGGATGTARSRQRRLGAAAGQRVPAFEGLPGLDDDRIRLRDAKIRPLEVDAMSAAVDGDVDERRVLAGVLSVDPDLRPGDGVHADRARLIVRAGRRDSG